MSRTYRASKTRIMDARETVRVRAESASGRRDTTADQQDILLCESPACRRPGLLMYLLIGGVEADAAVYCRLHWAEFGLDAGRGLTLA